MEWSRFVDLCERANIRAHDKWQTPLGAVYLGDRISYTSHRNGIDRVDLYEVFWFAEDGIGGFWGQPIRHVSLFHDDGRRITQEEFFEEALQQALGCMSDKLLAEGGAGDPLTTQLGVIPWQIDPVRKVVTGGIMNGGLHG